MLCLGMAGPHIKIMSVSMPTQLHRRMVVLLRHGDRSKLVAHLIERWLNGDITVSQSVVRDRRYGVVSNTTS